MKICVAEKRSRVTIINYMRIDKTFERFDAIVNGYRGSQIVFTANRLGLFDALKDVSLTATELAQRLETDLRATRILCDALAALGLLRKRVDRYGLTEMSKRYLLSDSPYSQNDLLLHGASLYERWGKMYDVLKSGKPIPREAVDLRLRSDEQRFARAMASSARLSAKETADAIDLKKVKTMLDVGGGPGMYAIEFAKRKKDLRVVIMDDAKTLEVAKENIEKAGLAARIILKAGDAFKDDPGNGYDLILVSNVIHTYSAEQNEILVKRCADALATGGMLCVKDFILTRCRTKPLKASLFAVNMLVNTEGGDCYTVSEIQGWMRSAGLKPSGTKSLYPPTKLVFGVK